MLCVFFSLSAQISTRGKPFSFKEKVSFEREKTLKRFSKTDLSNIAVENSITDSFELPTRFSLPIEANLITENSGEWKTLTDSTNVWRLQITIPESKAITLVYNKFWLPEGAKLYIFC